MYTPKDVIRSYQLIYDNKLYEKFHIFNGLQDDVDIVYDIIKSFIIDNLENKKFRTSIITCNDSINNINLSFCNLSIIINAKKFIVENDANSYITAVNGEYYNDEGDFKNKKFNIKIKFSISYVNLNEEFEEEIKKVIAHELTHAYNDYKAKLNGKTLHYIINTNLLINILNNPNKNTIEYYTAVLIYGLNKLEQQAIIAELYYDTMYKTVNNSYIQNPVDIFKKTNTIQILGKLYSYYKNLLNLDSKFYSIVEDTFKGLTNKSITYNKILKGFYKKIISFTDICVDFSSKVSYDLLKTLHESAHMNMKFHLMREDFKNRSQKIINEHHTLYNICLN